jgi:acetyl esterase/lipase
MTAALPLHDVDAWRVYLGLPPKRVPSRGRRSRGVLALGHDAVLKLYGPIVRQAIDEFPAALAKLRGEHGVGEGAIAFVGGSVGALVALGLVAAGELPIAAGELVSPALRLASIVAANERRFAVTYPWSDDWREVAAELDFLARVPELARGGMPTLLVVGVEDDAEGVASACPRNSPLR